MNPTSSVGVLKRPRLRLPSEAGAQFCSRPYDRVGVSNFVLLTVSLVVEIYSHFLTTNTQSHNTVCTTTSLLLCLSVFVFKRSSPTKSTLSWFRLPRNE